MVGKKVQYSDLGPLSIEAQRKGMSVQDFMSKWEGFKGQDYDKVIEEITKAVEKSKNIITSTKTSTEGLNNVIEEGHKELDKSIKLTSTKTQKLREEEKATIETIKTTEDFIKVLDKVDTEGAKFSKKLLLFVDSLEEGSEKLDNILRKVDIQLDNVNDKYARKDFERDSNFSSRGSNFKLNKGDTDPLKTATKEMVRNHLLAWSGNRHAYGSKGLVNLVNTGQLEGGKSYAGEINRIATVLNNRVIESTKIIDRLSPLLPSGSAFGHISEIMEDIYIPLRNMSEFLKTDGSNVKRSRFTSGVPFNFATGAPFSGYKQIIDLMNAENLKEKRDKNYNIVYDKHGNPEKQLCSVKLKTEPITIPQLYLAKSYSNQLALPSPSGTSASSSAVLKSSQRFNTKTAFKNAYPYKGNKAYGYGFDFDAITAAYKATIAQMAAAATAATAVAPVAPAATTTTNAAKARTKKKSSSPTPASAPPTNIALTLPTQIHVILDEIISPASTFLQGLSKAQQKAITTTSATSTAAKNKTKAVKNANKIFPLIYKALQGTRFSDLVKQGTTSGRLFSAIADMTKGKNGFDLLNSAKSGIKGAYAHVKSEYIKPISDNYINPIKQKYNSFVGRHPYIASLRTGAKSIGNSAIGLVKSAGGKSLGLVKTAGGVLADTKVGGAIAKGGGLLGKGAKGLLKFALGGPIGLIAAGVAATAVAAKGLFKFLAKHSPIMKAISDLLNLFFTLFFMPIGNALGSILLPLMEGLIDWVLKWNDLWTDFTWDKFGGLLWDMFSALIKWIVSIPQSIFNLMLDILDFFWSGIPNILADFFESIGWGGVATFFRVYGDIMGKAIDFIRGVVNNIFNSIKSFFNDPVGVIRSAVKGIINGAGDWLGDTWNNLTSWIPSFATGGIIPGSPGGTIVRVAEAGQTEVIVPLSEINSIGGQPIVINISGDIYGISDLESKIETVINRVSNRSAYR